ncbi:MAG TPA: hypothetical protein VKR80_04595 [Candidatus Limnocylindria bacterium]|nr:hypothetical protein [Candidatus Limnocylindria bacterium]
MTRARLSFPEGDPIEFALDDVVAFGPDIGGFRAWLGAVFASTEGRWLIRFGEDELLGFRRDELKRIRATPEGAELTLGPADEVVPVREADVTSYGPEPAGIRAWLGRLAHGRGDAWIRFADGRELRFAIGNGPHVRLLEPTDNLPEGGIRLPLT